MNVKADGARPSLPSRRWIHSVVLGVAIVLHTAATLARPPSAVLVYERALGTQSCPDVVGFRTQVTTRLGFDPFVAQAPLRVEATVTRAGDGFHGAVRALDEHAQLRGERRFLGASCSELIETMALTVSILLDPKSFEKPAQGGAEDAAPLTLDSPPALSTPPGEAQEPRAELGESAANAPTASSRDMRSLRLGAEAVGSVGAAPSAAVGAAALLGVGTNHWSLDVEGRIDSPVERTRADGTGVRSSLLLALLVPCVHAGWFVACPVIAAGALNGQGVNVDAPRRAATFYAALAARAGLEAPLHGPLAVRLHCDLGAPITRTTLNDRGQEVWTTPALFVSTSLGLVAHFP